MWGKGNSKLQPLGLSTLGKGDIQVQPPLAFLSKESWRIKNLKGSIISFLGETSWEAIVKVTDQRRLPIKDRDLIIGLYNAFPLPHTLPPLHQGPWIIGGYRWKNCNSQLPLKKYFLGKAKDNRGDQKRKIKEILACDTSYNKTENTV